MDEIKTQNSNDEDKLYQDAIPAVDINRKRIAEIIRLQSISKD